MSVPRITIAGAGNIGCFVGGVLAHAGFDVRFLTRLQQVAALEQHGLRLSDFAGLDLHLRDVAVTDDAGVALDGATLVLVSVKSGDTEAMARLIAAHAPAAQVISLQNGVANASTLRTVLTGADVRAATVPFNVVTKAPGHFHRASSGDILVEAGPIADLSHAHMAWRSVQNIEAIQWGKLLLNLGNAVNALADLPLLEQLQDRAWRRLLADQMSEALRILRAAGITPAKTTSAPPGLIPHILRLPTPLFRVIAASMLTIDAQARSSMWDDLKQGRKTEVDALQGAILHLADRLGRQAPLNARMRSLIRAAEAAGEGPPGLSPRDIRG
ncbi:2-dehydropantoate 2-reductase [uncultured Tateyamaria sp.]|uniref:2-dehydropantoate 2-reductase n=1 Tax=uncultured Tateyamaria sp. TaxID=455651 RepID=UPI00260E2137|nr:2-dehydropantoate 2-reductase [uncultured Tateyamaria sp.]